MQRGSSLNISDELQLSQVSVPPLPKDVVFPDELNRYLRDQIQSLTHENGMLCKNLSQMECQLKQSQEKTTSLASQLEEYQNVCPKNSLASSAQFASSKIVELSKKLRERNSEVEIYKTQCSKLKQQILDLEQREVKPEMREAVLQPPRPRDELEEQLKSAQEKLFSSNARLYEIKNVNMQLKNDLKMAKKVVQQEVGDSFENVVQNSPSWRGRAQVIWDLQQKNAEMKEKIKNLDKGSKGDLVPSKHDKRFEAMSKENDDLKAQMQEQKKRSEAIKARNKVLESENSTMRIKLATILDQTECDQQQIIMLNAKVNRAQDQQHDLLHSKQTQLDKLERENKRIEMDLAKQNCKIDNYQAQVDEQRREIEKLREKLKQQNPLVPHTPHVVDTKALNQLEAERLRLLDLMKVINERLESERSAYSALQAKFLSERQKTAKLERKLACLQLDQQSDRMSSYSICSLKSRASDSAVEDKLELAEETVKALQTRLQLERDEHKADIDEFSKILQNHNVLSTERSDVSDFR